MFRFSVAFLALALLQARLPAFAGTEALNREPILYASEGLKISGLLSKPAGDGPFPLILLNHGGFDPADRLGGLLDLFARLGYVVIASDYRGIGKSEGQREVAHGEVADVLNAITYARTKPYVDGGRVVMWGFSHGAAIAFLAAAREPGIKAIVAVEGPVDLTASYHYWLKMNLDAHPPPMLSQLHLLIGGTPEEKPEAWKIRTPLFAVASIKCPVYLIYGGKDLTVPVAEGQKMADALRSSGNTNVTLVIDSEAKHGLDAPAFLRVRKGMVNFLNQYANLPPVP